MVRHGPRAPRRRGRPPPETSPPAVLTGSSRTVTNAAILVALGFLGSRLLGALRAVVIANEYGASADLDAFFVAQRLPELVFQLLAGRDAGQRLHPGLRALPAPSRRRRSLAAGVDRAERRAPGDDRAGAGDVRGGGVDRARDGARPGRRHGHAGGAARRRDLPHAGDAGRADPVLRLGHDHRHPQRAAALPAARLRAHALQPGDHPGRAAAALRPLRRRGAGDRGDRGRRRPLGDSDPGADRGRGADRAVDQDLGSGRAGGAAPDGAADDRARGGADQLRRADLPSAPSWAIPRSRRSTSPG